MSDENIKSAVHDIATIRGTSSAKRLFMKKEQERNVSSLNVENIDKPSHKTVAKKKGMSTKTVSGSLPAETLREKAKRSQCKKGYSSSPVQGTTKSDCTNQELSDAVTQMAHSSNSPGVDHSSNLSANKSSDTKEKISDSTVTDTTYSSGCATSKSETHETPVKSKAKKKSVRHIASRYKTAALLAAKTTVSRGNTPVLRENQKSHLSGKLNSTSTFSTTPTTVKQNGEHRYPQQTDKANCITSTPTLDDSKVPILSYDASSIAADQSSFLPQCKSHLLKPLKITTKFKPSQPYTKTSQNFGHPTLALPLQQNSKESLSLKQPLNPELMTQTEVDLLYVQYIQAAFLESRAAKSLQMRSHDAMEQLYNLWTVNQILMEQEKCLDADLNTLGYLQHLQENLSIQEQYLQPVIKSLPQLDSQYNEISETVDTLRHHLPISGVSMPNEIEHSEEELSTYLEECENIMQTVYKTSTNQSELTTVANLLSHLSTTVEAEIKEVDRCLHLISSAEKMVVSESSLKMEVIQFKEHELKTE